MIVDRACCALTMSCYRARNHGETSGEVSILNRTWSTGRNYWFNCAPLRRQFICLHKIWRNVRNIFVGASTALGKARIIANRSAVLAVGVRSALTPHAYCVTILGILLAAETARRCGHGLISADLVGDNDIRRHAHR